MKRRQRVYAYITHAERLLVFEHVDVPEAGIQVPAGTIEPGEAPPTAVLREAAEETGLPSLALDGALGDLEHDMRELGFEEVQHALFYHLRCEGEPPERWRHDETGGGTAAAIRFELYWAPLDRLPPLMGLCGARVAALRARLAAGSRAAP